MKNLFLLFCLLFSFQNNVRKNIYPFQEQMYVDGSYS